MRAIALAILVQLAGASSARAEHLQPFFAFGSGPAVTGADGGTVTFTTEWNNLAGAQTAFVMKQFANGTVRKTMAEQTSLSLLANRRFRADWEFEVMDPTALGFVYSVNGSGVAGQKAQAFKNSVRIAGIKGVSFSAGIDPLIGMASFDVFADGTPLSSGEVRIGIAGQEVFTNTTRTDGSFKSIPEMKDDLLDALHAAMFTSAFIDPDTGLILVTGVPTGDPEGTLGVDVGASFYTTADGIGGFAQVEIPEPATFVLLSLSMFLAAGYSAVRRKP